MKYDEQTEKLFNYLIGQVIKKLKADHNGKCAEPSLIRTIFEEMLEVEAKKRNQNQVVDSKPSNQV